VLKNLAKSACLTYWLRRTVWATETLRCDCGVAEGCIVALWDDGESSDLLDSHDSASFWMYLAAEASCNLDHLDVVWIWMGTE
jgi:hypothetical protein